MKLTALYLVRPHAEEIATREKTAVVKAKRFDVAGKTYWLAGEGRILGTVQLGPAKEISLQEFTKLFPNHRVTEDERKAWWPGVKALFFYPVVGVRVFKKPFDWELPRGAQTFVRDVEIPTDAAEFINEESGALKRLEANAFTEPMGALAQHPMGKGVEKFKPTDLSQLNEKQLLNLHGNVMDEMRNRKLPADRIHREQIKLSDMPSLVQAFQAVREYQVRQPAGRAFPFVYQWHARAIPEDWTDKDAAANIENGANEPISVHADLRMERPGKGAIGWTLFTPGTQKKRDQFLKGNQVQGIPKDPHPESWLGFKGRIPKGEDGATAISDGFIITKGKGVLTYGTQKRGFHEYFLKFTDSKLAHLNGRWIFTRTTDMWQVLKPKEQEPYVDTHTEAKDRGSGSELWQYSPVPGLDIPRADEPKSTVAQEVGPGKPVLVK